MSRAKLDRYVDDTETIDVESDNNMLDNSASNSSMYLRSQATTYLKDSHCAVCCKGEENGKLRKVETYIIHDKLHNKALNDYQLMARLESSLDAIAGDVHYHSLCLLQSGSLDQPEISSSRKESHDKLLRQLTKEIQYRTCRGQAVLLSDRW